MADEKQVSLLLAGIDGWNEWRKENADVAIDLGNANLRGAILSSANLAMADLSGTELTGVSLRNANLRKANLRKANFIGANLTGANLAGANLSGAHVSAVNLRDTNFSGATLNHAFISRVDLRGVDLSGVDLFDTYVSNADLSGANLSDATLSNTAFCNIDLSDAKGLETCEHLGPSTLDHRTLEVSRELPIVFLRGCGLPDTFIDFLPSMLGQAIAFYSCFISYSHADKVFARRLHDQLQGKGIRCWLDEHQLKPGDDIYEGVDRGIRLWDKVLLCCSEASLSSWWVEREVDTAIEKEQQLRKEHGYQKLVIIPLNLDGYMFDWTGSHAATLRKRLAADFTGWEQENAKFEAQFESVVAALQSDEQSREKPPKPKL